MVRKIDGARSRTWRVALLAIVAIMMLSVWATSAAAASLGQITEFSAGLQGKASNPTGIAAGPDGNLWFTDLGCTLASNPGTCAVGRITPSGAIAEFSAGLQAGNKSGPYDIVLGPDGNLWFTDSGVKHLIGRITPSGVITEFSAGLQAGNKSFPRFIAPGPDGNLWFTDWGCVPPGSGACAIGRITPTGAITEFSAGLQAGNKSFPLGIAAGPDGNLWFTDIGCAIGGTCEIGRITPSGTITEFSTGLQSNAVPGFIAASPDGNMWFTDVGGPPNGTPAIGRITPCTLPCTPAIREFSTGLQAGKGSYPYAIASGPDGNMWFTDQGASGPGHGISEIGRITPSGTITESSAGLPTGTLPQGIATGPDGNLWFTDRGTLAIGQLASRAPAVSTGSASRVTGSGASVGGTVNPLGGAVSAIAVQYGPTTAYGSTVASTPVTLPPGGAPVAVSATISGLPPETVIHYRVVATNGVGSTPGLDRTFTTDAVTPVISGARQSHSTWREGNRRAPSAKDKQRNRKKPRIGTTFSFTLNEQASVKFVVTQIVRGTKVKGRCVATRKTIHRKSGCKRTVTRGTLTFMGQRGVNKVSFRGLIYSRKLKPGRYTLVIVASVAGRASAPARLGFTIVAG